MKSRPIEAANVVLGGEIIGISGGDDRCAEFALDSNDVMLAGQRCWKDFARGGIHPVGVQVDKLEVVFACHPSNGIDIAHLITIGRLVSEIELQSDE